MILIPPMKKNLEFDEPPPFVPNIDVPITDGCRLADVPKANYVMKQDCEDNEVTIEEIDLPSSFDAVELDTVVQVVCFCADSNDNSNAICF